MTKEKLKLNSLKKRTETIQAEIIQALLETPLRFKELLQTINQQRDKEKMSPRTLFKYLKSLEKDGLISTKIEGRKIVYKPTADKVKTILQLRKEFLYQLYNLLRVYAIALNQKTATITQNYLNIIKESIEKPEKEAETLKVLSKTVELRKGFKSIVPISDFHGKTEFKKAESVKCKNCGQSHPLIEDMHGFYYVCPTDNKVRRIGDVKVNSNLTVQPLKLKRNRKRKVKNVLG